MMFPSEAKLAAALGLAGRVAATPAQTGQHELAITTDQPGPTLKFDWPAIQIGVATYEAGPTGVTSSALPSGRRSPSTCAAARRAR
jgi:hypothetical protein